MNDKCYKPIIPGFPHMLHGGDYNPDQWADFPEIINEDMRLIPLAHCNAMSINIFSWTTLEKEEGVYDFSFLDDIMNRLDAIGAKAVLATPSGARPAWMSKAHPEVLRTNADRTKNLHGGRHNHCYTSPYYRKKVYEMNKRLAERYKDHPALILWHISNEYGGECHCELCQEAFRDWLKEKYHNSLDELNRAYWTKFWSHTYTDWAQIESPSPLGEQAVHGLNLDWKRFVTYQTGEFIKNEIEPLKAITPDIPVTTNFMALGFDGLDYFELKNIVDVVSWDNYPAWHSNDDVETAQLTAFTHDYFRSMKNKPFLLMESTPSLTNWHEFNKLKRPKMHTLSSLQAIAHGSDSVQYFQWRKSRGSSEKLHGAVVDHCGHENTRVFREVSELGKTLGKLDGVVGTHTVSETAILFDRQNDWAIKDMQGLAKSTRKYEETCENHYKPFWNNGVNTDIIDSTCDFEQYKLIIAPMLYMLRPGMEEKIEKYVKNGGTFVCTYASGWVDENDLCYLGGFPGGILKDVFGIWAEEIDTLYPHDSNLAEIDGRQYKAIDYCELVHETTASVLGTYKQDFYAGMPALTCNKYGSGKAYYITFRDTGDFLNDFYGDLIKELGIKRALTSALPHGVTAHTRQNGELKYLFIENFNTESKKVSLDCSYTDVLTDELLSGEIEIGGFETLILKRNAN